MAPSNPQTNRDLDLLLDQREQEWAMCAAQVDAVYSCQQKVQEAGDVKAK